MQRAITRGQPLALASIEAMVRGDPPHALLLVGPPATGKTTLALDLAAGLLCEAGDRGERPCRTCRGCRLVVSGNHPDLHRLAPEGPGGQVRLGDAHHPEPGTVRHLIGELALLPVEGGARVAVVEAAHRLNEDAQNALLKTLEEPPAGATIVLCADDEERLLPTVRSRCVRVRLGPVASREIERWLDELGVADPHLASGLARLAGGRPGLALAYARSPDAVRLRGELLRGLLDLLAADRRQRLSAIRGLTSSAAALNAALSPLRPAEPPPAPRARARGGRRQAAAVAGPPEQTASGADPAAATPGTATPGTATPAAATTVTAADRRAAAAVLLDAWTSLARDLAVSGMAAGAADGHVVDSGLFDELAPAAAGLEAAAVLSFLHLLTDASARLEQNVNPELLLDVLALRWPHPAGTSGAERRPDVVRSTGTGTPGTGA